MTRQNWLIAALLLILLGALGVWVGANLEEVEEPERAHLRGEARRDPLYAARLLMGRLGYATAVVNDPLQLARQPRSATIVLSIPVTGVLAERVEPELVEWVRQGGHLVLAGTGHSARFTQSLGMETIGWHAQKHDDKEPDPLKLDMEGRRLTLDLPYCEVFRVSHPLVWSGEIHGFHPYKRSGKSGEDEDEDEDEDTPRMHRGEPKELDANAIAAARWRLGEGMVTAVCNDFPIENPSIGKNHNAEFAVRMLAVDTAGPVVFVPRPDFPGLFDWLVENAWAVGVSGSVLIALVLWQSMPRFGPVAPEPPPARPGLREHLFAVGGFHLRKHHYERLLHAHREHVLRLAERHGGPNYKLEDIAVFVGVDVNELEHALRAKVLERHTYLRLAAVLARAGDALLAANPLSSSTHRSRKS